MGSGLDLEVKARWAAGIVTRAQRISIMDGAASWGQTRNLRAEWGRRGEWGGGGEWGQPAFEGCAAEAGVVATSVEARLLMGEWGHRCEVSHTVLCVAGSRRSEEILPVGGIGA